MDPIKKLFKQFSVWIFISIVIGIACGSASAIFLYLLERATHVRESHEWLIYFLPFGGYLVGWLYHSLGKQVESGNNLVLEELHDPKSVLPFRMTPLVLTGTLVTHLFGGSAGREGTAVQMGASISDQLTHLFKLSPIDRRRLLMAGMAAGFGSIFGVPLAGAVFGMEVSGFRRLTFRNGVECAIAAMVAHWVALRLGVTHTQYPQPETALLPTPLFAMYAVGAGAIFGLAARMFSLITDHIKENSENKISYLPVRAFVGGTIVAFLFLAFPFLQRYAGLGITTMVDAFQTAALPYDWFAKISLTAITLGFGFKGGEVTPLLFVGATLGSALSPLMPIPLPIITAMGFVAVFAGAARTPITCVIMAMELFGHDIGVYAALACLVSCAVTGNNGIYRARPRGIPNRSS